MSTNAPTALVGSPRAPSTRDGLLAPEDGTSAIPAWSLPLLVVLAAAFCFLGTGSGSLRTYDEAIYAQVSREILERGEWATMHHNGAPWFHKPPLQFWLTAAVYRVAGVSEGSVRFVPALFGVATVLGVYLLSRPLLGNRVALVGALVLLATPHYLELSKVGMLDVPLTFFVTLAVLSYGRGLERPGWLAVAGAAFGLAFLTKGVAALVAPLACALHLLVSRRFDLLRSGWLWLGGLAAVAIAAPWHLHQWRLHGDAFLDEYLGYHVLRRGREAIEGHEGSPLFFVETLFEHQLPWVLLLPIAIPAAVLAVVKRGRRELLLPLLWGATILGLYSAAATKISWYILPAYPALALCIADWLVRKVPPHRFRSLLVGILAVLALVGATESRVFDLDYEPDVKALAIEARDLLPPESILFVHQTDTPTVLFYAERPVRALDGARLDVLREELRRSGFALGVVRGEDQVDMVLGILEEADAVVVGRRGEDWLVRWSPRAVQIDR